ncbi:hypothetical protein NDU88_003243 [Pleurodeles waltl]|uniref:Uncharacterized protein n=1 Tax=Pleurodeles waltl TaxID=8319 RepID=A0AAV7VF80_PLEWA|nr:hypothetical protein NDU88_003243 [Pleurodeles waltl]
MLTNMAEGLTFDDEEVTAILSAPSLLGDTALSKKLSQLGDWDTLVELKRTQVKTILHGAILAEYLRSNTAPNGLIVSNEPRIFLEDLEFRKDWALIAQNWLILIIKTATRLSEAILIQIKTSENNLKTGASILSFKKKLEETNKNMNEYRPIVSAIGSILEPLSQFCDVFLQPLVKQIPTYLKDTTDALSLLDSMPFDKNAELLITLDVESLYTIIPQEATLGDIYELLEADRRDSRTPPEFILDLAHLALTRNYFEFENQFYL